MTRRRIGAAVVAVAVLAPLSGVRADPLPVPTLLALACAVLPVTAPRVLVGVEPGTSVATLARAGGTATGRIVPLDVVEVSFPTELAAGRGLAALRATPGVRWAEPEATVEADVSPSDPLLPLQWGLTKIGARPTWDVEVGTSNPVTVAVLDTGIDLEHPDLQGRATSGFDFINGDGDASEDHFHGTHVAGIVGAATDNRRGVAGMSWGARLLSEKVLDSRGRGSICAIAAGVVHAVTAGARVLNLSLGVVTTRCPRAIAEAIDFARRSGALVVASAGNKARKGNPVQYPAGCAGVVPVGATTERDGAAPFSTHQPYVALSAPGVGIVSTFRTAAGVSSYGKLDGTSQATPFVAGLAALLFAAHPDWTADQVTERMARTAVDLGPRGRDEWFGYGRIDARRALGR